MMRYKAIITMGADTDLVLYSDELDKLTAIISNANFHMPDVYESAKVYRKVKPEFEKDNYKLIGNVQDGRYIDNRPKK